MIDLDRVEELAATYPADGWVQNKVPSLVAELRAAREVQQLLHTAPRDQTPLGVALAHWDQFTRPAPEARP